MLLPAEVDRQIALRQSWDRLGEEGKLYRIQVDADQGASGFYAKLWYSIREIPEGGSGRWKFIGMPRESGLSVISPYLHKRLFHEYRVVHALFPANTLQVTLAYDQRVRVDKAGNLVFTIQGYPVTVSREVCADSDLMAQRDRILMPMYDMIHAARDKAYAGDPSANADPALQRAIIDADARMAGLFGPEMRYLGAQGSLSIKQVTDDLRRESPQSPILAFLQSGILPVHPAFNFIPQAPGSMDAGPHRGTFIELMIYDVSAAHEQLRHRTGHVAAAAVRSIARFELYARLERLFDAVLRHPRLSSRIINDPRLQSALFLYTEQVRKAFNHDPARLGEQWADITASLVDTMSRH